MMNLEGRSSRARLQTLADDIRVDDREVTQELYSLGSTLVWIAGVFGKAAMGDIARSLRVLIGLTQDGGRWDRQAVQLHLDSLRWLTDSVFGEEQTKMIGAALSRVVERDRQPGQPSPC